MGKKKISIGTWAFIWGGYKEDPIPFDVVLDTLKKLGYDGSSSVLSLRIWRVTPMPTGRRSVRC